jgi:hypothetical protein
MAWELAFLKPLAGPAAGLLARLHPVRRIRTRVSRGKGCFRFPLGKIYILVPERLQGSHYVVEANDMRAANEVGEMFLNLGYRRGKDWDFYHVRPDKTLPQDVRRQNLISICGPSANSFVRELLADSPDLLSSAHHIESSDRTTRRFRWRNRVYASHEKADFAYLAVLPNPFNDRRQLVVMFGLRTIGTYGAALLYSGTEYKDMRSSLQLQSTNRNQKLDVLLYVGRGNTPTGVSVVRLALPGDGVPDTTPVPEDEAGESASTLFSAQEYLRRLQTVAEAIRSYDRKFVYSKMVYTYTIMNDFSYRFDEIETFSPVDNDVLIYWKHYLGTVPCVPLDSLRFRAEMVAPGSGQEITWLPARNDPLRKDFLIFPLPPMQADEPARTIHCSAVWPGGAEPLKAPNGRDLFQVRIQHKAASPVKSVEINIEFEAPGIYLVQRVQEGPSAIADAGDWQECRINKPYRVTFTDVVGGTMFSFHVHRRS